MTTAPTWTITPEPVDSAESLELLRTYFVEVADRYYRLHEDRDSTPEEIESGLAGAPSDFLAPPTGIFLVGRHDGVAAACAGLKVRDATTVELTRVFVRPDRRGTGVATLLMEAVDAAARDLGAERIVLDTRLDLVEARALYLRSGYAEVPAFSDGPYAEVWYRKELA
ncbi:GNAT family N-acetyltransferase [Umezawaea endophytica]|uniref:GNAT family N-acetyltransferase n=1 Tax=Umezawaea endophytica TaxID=1654476 RepID=A0A9X2VXG5_9PSEU|nr:GNAT family N-acetyltransferase [Umezawaea endophytica]MCS7484608.1 GNAT family N-acetyltransferase [Umezawaea endophytica]